MNFKKLTFKRINSVKIKFSLTSESCFAFLLAMVWASNTFVDYFRAVLLRIPYISGVREYIISFIFIAALFLSLPYMIKRVDPRWVLFYFGVVITYLLNLFLFPDNKTALMDNMYPFLVEALPLIFVGMCIDLKKHYKLLYVISVISVIFRFFHLMLDPINMANGAMNASYEILPHICMVIAATLARMNAINILVSVLGIIMTFAFGTRGPVLCILFLVISYMIVFKKVYKHVWLFSFSVILIVCVAFLYEEITVLLLDVVERMGMSTRIFDMLLSGKINDSTGREAIQATLLEAINRNWLGYGIAGDRAIVGVYAHNILIEFWVSFGVFIGSALFIVPVFFIVKLLVQKSKNNTAEDGFILVLISSCFIKLFLSGTYLTESFLFLLIGVLFSEYRKSKRANLKLYCEKGL